MSKADLGETRPREEVPHRGEELAPEAYRAAVADVIYLASCVVKDETPDKTRVVGMNLERLYMAADQHLLTAITACALERAGVCDPAFTQAWTKAIRKTALFESEREAILRELDKAGIWYLPLKGIVMKDYYPEFGVRQMSDNDILFDSTRSEDVRAIMERLGFRTVTYGHSAYGHDSYYKEPVCHFEMHRSLFKPYLGQLCAYYENIKDKLLKDAENTCGYHFRDEDFYIYMVAHEYRHYTRGGTGLRSLLDTYVFLRRFDGELDEDDLRGEFEKLRLTDYERQNRSLSLHLFGGEPLTEADREMLDYVLASGTYGTMEHCFEDAVNTYGEGIRGQLRYVVDRLVLPPDIVKSVYPLFWKVPILLPLLPLYRGYLGYRRDRAGFALKLKSLLKLKARPHKKR